MFVQRLLSGIFLLVLAFITIISGGNILLGTITILSFIGQFELYRVLKLEKSSLAYIGYVFTILYEAMLYFQKKEYIELFFLMFLMLLLCFYVICYPKYVYSQIAMVFTGFVYVTVMLSCIYQVRMTEIGKYAVWLIFISAWGSDTCAYCVGKLAGKHKLPSQLSPKKTIEGCIGGILGAVLIAFIYGTVFKEQLTGLSYNPGIFAFIAGIGAFISQIGDLAASAIKRNHEIKDYGKLIPGHGGILDRFDSIIFTAPIAYFLITVL